MSVALQTAVLADAVSDLRAEARELMARTQPQQAAERLAQALTLPGAAEGEAGAALWLELADAQTRAGQPKLAMQSAEKAWKLREALWGPGHALTLAALNDHLDNCPGAGAARQCEPLIAGALRRAEALPGPPAALLAALLRTQALIENQLGRAPAALPLLDRAVALWRQDAGGDARRHAASIFSALTGKAVLLLNLGRPGEGLAVLDELQPLQTALLGERSDDVLATLRSRTHMLVALGRLGDAERAAADVLAHCEAVLGLRHPRTHTARVTLGQAQLEVGKYRQALDSLDRAMRDTQRDAGPSEQASMHARLFHAQALRRTGQAGRAAEELELLVADQLRLHGERSVDYATFVAAWAGALWDAGQTEAALAQFDRALAMVVENRGAQHPSSWVERHNRLRARAEAGLTVPAAEAEAVVDALRRARGDAHPSTMAAAQLHASLLTREGRPAEALALLQPLAERRLAVLGPAHIDTLHSQALQARLLARTGRAPEAVQLLQTLMPQVENLRESLAPLGAAAPPQALADLQPLLAERAVLLAGSGQLEAAFTAIEAHKARGLLAQLARQRALDGAGLPAVLNETLQHQAQRRAALLAALAGASQAERRAGLHRELQALERDWADTLDQARLAHPRFAQLMTLAPADRQMLARLAPGQALVHFLQGDDERWFALVGRRDGSLRWHELGRLPGLRDSVEALRVWTASQGQRLPSDSEGRALPVRRVEGGADGPRWTTRAGSGTLVRSAADYLALRHFLGERLLAPLLPALSDAGSLLIAPDGALGLLPWDQLPVRGAPALRRWQISQVASLSVLAQRRAAVAGGQRLLAFGVDEPVQSDGQAWPGLPRAAQEARALAALFKGSRAYAGAEASEAELRRWAADGRLAGVRTLALAAHARFDPARPQQQAVLLAGTGSDPMIDGALLVSDWVALPLHSELLILSACDSARGALLPGEGLTGFAYAAQVAGNRNLLATLWPVRDGAAADFVPAFMRRVMAGHSHREALALTKREFTASPDPRRNSPAVWAAFVLVGA